MTWQKKGLIYVPAGKFGWDNNTVITPTPVMHNDETIRVYCGFRDKKGVSRIGYIDVSADNPSNVISVSETPVLDIGRPGCFDDNGMILGDVVYLNNEIRMYYVGFQIPQKIKFMAYSGIALSKDNGKTFKRYSEVPIMERADNALYIRAIHTAMFDNGRWKIWYSVGNRWENINGIDYPQYDIRYTESQDGFHFDDTVGKSCVGVNENEYRIGRPRVNKEPDGSYTMRYTSDTYDKKYRAGYATSKDGMNWTRIDTPREIDISSDGWDSEMACYPVFLDTGKKKFLFYSGNGMGATGVGYAKWNKTMRDR